MCVCVCERVLPGGMNEEKGAPDFPARRAEGSQLCGRGGWKPYRIGLSLTGLGVLSSLIQEKQDEYDSSPGSGGCSGGCGGRLSLCLHPQNRGRTPGRVLQVSGVCSQPRWKADAG